MRNLSSVIICIVFTLMLLGKPADCEYYRYTDENGVLHFTDNLNDVPVQQRKNISIYKNASEKKGNRPSTSMENQKPQERSREQRNIPPSTQDEIRELNIEKQALEKEFEQLVNRKQALMKEKKQARTTKEISEFQRKITTLNLEISAYEQRRAAFEEKRKKFDQGSFKIKAPAEQ